MSFPKFNTPWRQSTYRLEYDSVAPEENIPLDDEHHSPADEIAGLQHSLHALRLWLIAIGVVSGLAFLIVAGARYSNKLPPSLRWHKSPIPDIPIVPETLDQDDRYAVVSSPESNHIWHSLIPAPGTGFVTVQNPRQYPDLKPGMAGSHPNEEIYGVSLFHQLHCVIHALMCNADLTLEWPRTVEDEGGKGKHGIVDGNHIPHQCKNWDTIFDWASRNAYAQDGPT
ncbi:hypothetical protein LTR12_008851 [Friedmanniomyces endolithicus]|nr:hypothetical protein LTR74_004575 [Friedmanniomyces endolithicus]KAK1816705.1 hypothetical protein LTR12_008851 [Friedmanniomyces endolithicus]